MDVAAAWRLNVRARWRSAFVAAHYNNHNNDNINDNNDEYLSVPLLNERGVFAFKVQANLIKSAPVFSPSRSSPDSSVV